MTKSELKTGMIVTLRNKMKMFVYRDCATTTPIEEGVFVNQYTSKCNYMTEYGEDLTHKVFSSLDIMKVEKVVHPFFFQRNPNDILAAQVCWVREEARKMTKEEIEEILGYKIEIV